MKHKKLLVGVLVAVSCLSMVVNAANVQDKEYTVEDYKELIETVNEENEDCFQIDILDYDFLMRKYSYNELKDVLVSMAEEQRELTYGITE